MGKVIINPDDLEGATDWIFPQIDISKTPDPIISNLEEEQEEISAIEVLKQELLEKQKIKELEIESIKNELKTKINVIDSIITQIKDPLSFIDDNFIELIQSIIKKMVKNIIYKEIDADPKIINSMVANLKEMINGKNGTLTVYLSEVDYKRFTPDEINNLLSVKMDSSLKEGDVVIKENYAEIHAILDERLDKMMDPKK